jgi:hypothetical protein
MRRHDWIFDVLSDLQDYALANGLPDLATSAALTLAVARWETAASERPSDPLAPQCGQRH